MSAREPFATVDESGDVWVNGAIIPVRCHGDLSAAHLNAAHADRVAAELEAAAEEINWFDGSCRDMDSNPADLLRARAKAIREGGAA